MWVLELLFSGSWGGLISDWIQSYLKKHPKTGYIKAFFVGFGCLAVPSMLYGLVVLNNKNLLNRLLISGAISSACGLVTGFLAVIFLFSTKHSIAKKAKSQLLPNQDTVN